MKRRFCSLCLILALVCFWAMPALAGDTVSGVCGENVTWTLEGTTLTISGTGAMEDYSYSEPAPWKAYVGAIVHLVVEEGVTTLGSNAMSQCEKLLDVSLPESLTAIGEDAFYYCDVLVELTLPQGLTTLDPGAFESCSMLTSVNIPQGLTEIPSRAFSGCHLLEQVELHEGITAIGDNAFYGCRSLTAATIPASVTELGYSLFANCSSLEEIIVDADNEHFVAENGMLCNIDKTLLIQAVCGVEELVMPETLTEIGSYALCGCENLTSIVVPDGVKVIGSCAFYDCTNVEYMVIPASVEEMGYGALENGGYLGFSETTTDIYYGGDEVYWNELMEQSMTETEGVVVHFGTTEVPVEAAPEPVAETVPEETSGAEADSAAEAAVETQEAEDADTGSKALPILLAAAVLIVALVAVFFSKKKTKSGV